MAAKRKNIFEDLGKATLRGVRKCPKCGTYNGTRGSSCKNKECKLTFKIVKTKVKDSDEVVAVRINCIGLQIFSVRLQEYGESTYNNRFFVRIPLIEGMETLQDEAEASMIMRSAAVCFAPACKKPTEDFSTITLNMNPCSHTLSVVNCTNEAKPLILKEALLSMLPISDAMKQDIYNLLKSDEESFLVQRLNKTTMVVKCMPDELHPVGFLHFYLYEPLKNARKYKILCECKVGVTKPFVPRERQLCMHYYMCICAFASDEKLTEEFKNLIHSVYMKSPAITTDDVFKCSLSEDFADLRDFFVDDICPPSKRKKNVLLDSNTLFFLSQNESDVSAKVDDDIPKHSINLTDGKPIYTFDEWLGSVVERINQTMHYKFDGHPDPLVFHVPQSFFNVLQQRLSEGSKKKRLPNSVTCYCRKDTLPFGIFSKYTWNITNIIQLKRIFYTPEVVLDVQRCFYEPREGMFVPLKEDRLDTAENSKKLNESAKSSEPKQKQIRPVELKTFLKVGQTALDQKEPTPFIVEWIPDILPQSHIGEMRLKFEYGHQRNGLIEHRTPVSKPATAS